VIFGLGNPSLCGAVLCTRGRSAAFLISGFLEYLPSVSDLRRGGLKLRINVSGISTSSYCQHQHSSNAAESHKEQPALMQVPRSPSQGHTQGAPRRGSSSTHQSGRLSSLLCHESKLKLGPRNGYKWALTELLNSK
jgi:hypothetical protein